MRAHPIVWALRVCWLLLPFTTGDAVGLAVEGRSTAVAVAVGVIAWLGWATVLIASIVAHPVSLTVLRILAPVAPLATVAALTVWAPTDPPTSSTILGAIGLAASLVAAAAALSGVVADEYVDAASYGPERRFALRVPIAFVLGPVPVFWIALVGGCLVGPVLLAAGAWIPGALLTLIGAAVAVPAAKAFHGLSRRWLVFVPAGVTLIDHLGLVDPVLFPARQVAAFGPATEGTTATDLTQNALGLVLEIAFDTPVEVMARTSKAEGETQLLRAVLISPVRPGAVVAEADRRGLRTAVSA